MDSLEERFSSLLHRIAAHGDVKRAWQHLRNMYTTPPRAYHNLDHIDGCLRQLDRVRSVAMKPDQIEAAVWYHDCVYDPMRSDNELRSADFAEAELKLLGIGEEFQSAVRELILATTHSAAPTSPDAQLLVDIDLSILGAEPAAFDRYEQAIRQEYAHIDDASFAAGRTAILKAFLNRPTIYSSSGFRSRFERSARKNLVHSVAKLAAQ